MRLLFIRFSSIGDIVLTTPAVRCAKNQIPGVEIHFLTKLSMKDLVIGNPNIDQFHFLDENINPDDFPLLSELQTELQKQSTTSTTDTTSTQS